MTGRPLDIYFSITIVLSLLGWTGLARQVRGKILALREEDYVTAAYLVGVGHGRILFRHLVSGFTSHIIVSLTLAVPGVILGETALSFLGLGFAPTNSKLGRTHSGLHEHVDGERLPLVAIAGHAYRDHGFGL